MRTFLNFLRRNSPDFVSRAGESMYAYLPFSIRYGRVYRETLAFLRQSEGWSSDRLAEYQIETFRILVDHAMRNVPYYRDLYREHGITPSSIHSFEDVLQVPTLDKDVLRERRESLKSENFPASAFQYHTTGGSTAHPVGLYWEAARTVPMEKAFMKRQFGWVGYDFGRDRVANLRGIPPREGKAFEIVAGRELRLSSYHLTSERMDLYVDAIRDFSPPVFQAYPSSALIFATHLLEKGITLPSIRLVLCGSEQLFDWQREIISRAFAAPLHSWYGQSEYVAFASECESSSEYHFHPEYGLAEIIRPDGLRAASGEMGEIIGTSFLNRAFPLIRYRTEDLATVSALPECPCGRPYLRVSRIDGRIQEMIVSRDGNLISMTAINMHDDTFDSLRQFQFVQEEPGKIFLRIIPNVTYSADQKDRILRALHAKLGNQFEIVVEVVDAVEYTARGKTRFLVQRLKLDPMWSTGDSDIG